ncbi:MAG: TolC family protein [Vicinamibacterales bacterium]
MLGVRRRHLVGIALLALATTAGAQSSDNSGPRIDLALQDAIARALARNLDISVERLDQQVIEVARINRDIADIDLRQTIANTVSSVQNAYWDLVHTTQTVAVQQQRLERAETLVRENEARVDAGTLDPIQTVQARAEAAVLRQRLAEAQQHLATAELALKRLIVGGTDDAYWAATLNPVDSPQLDVQPTQPTAAAVPGISRRIEAATEARELAEERLAIEQSRFAAGLQTNFFVVQAQRDLATAKDTELRAILDHQKALVEFERVQRTSLSQPLISIVR